MLGIEFLLSIPFSIKYNQLDKPTKFVYFYLLISLVFAGSSLITAFLTTNNLWLFALMHYLQFVVLSLFYKEIIHNIKIKKSISFLIVVVLIIALLDFFKFEGIKTYNSIAATAKNICLMVYCVIYFLQLIKDEELIEKAIYINSLSSFWFNAGIFIYLCTSVLFSLCGSWIQASTPTEQQNFLVILGFTYIMGIVQLLLFYVGLTTIFKKIKNV